MTISRTGGCVCGAVRLVAKGEPLRVTCCHCTWCQRRTGTAFGTEVVYAEENVEFSPGPNTQLGTYNHISDESGRWLIQEFCLSCGSNIGLILEAVPGIRSIAAGAFDDPKWLTPDKYEFRHVYTGSAQAWCEVPDGMQRYEQHFRQ